METGKPVVLGPPGSDEPPKSSSTARPSPAPAAARPSPAPAAARPPPAAAQPSPAPAPAAARPPPAAAGSSAAAAGADKSAGNTSKPSAAPTSSAASAMPGPSKDGAGPNSGTLSVGTYARISGLKAAPDLNGKLCQVVRKGDTPDRTVVRTSVGEKALKHANIESGGAVYPKHMMKVSVILFILALLVVGDVCRTRGRSALSAAALPLVGAICLFVALGVCMSVWWSCRPKTTWFPPVSELGANAPIRNVYRGGFLVFAVLFAITNGLYQELLLNRIEIPAPMEVPVPAPDPAPPTVAEDAVATDATGDAATTAKTDGMEACSWTEHLPQCYGLVNTVASTQDECQSACCADVTCSVWQYNVSWEPVNDGDPSACWIGASSDCSGQNNNSHGGRKQVNVTKEPRRNSTNEMLITGPDRSLEWGYAAAAGAGLQALFIFDGKFNVQSVLHSLAMFLFALGVFQHSVQSNFWLSLPWGKSLVEAPGLLGSVLKFRRTIAEYGPLVLMMGPLTSQFWSTSQRATAGRSRQSASMKSIFQDSGMPKSIALMLWALMLLVGVFYGSFAFDFWYATEHPGAFPELMTEQEL